jgi:hypothetical protein
MQKHIPAACITPPILPACVTYEWWVIRVLFAQQEWETHARTNAGVAPWKFFMSVVFRGVRKMAGSDY